MTASSTAYAATGKQWTRRRFFLGGVLIPGVVAGVSSWLHDGVDARKKKRRKSRKKPKGSWSLLAANYDVDAEEQAFLGLVNAYRAEKGRPALALNSQLSVASASHSLDMGLNSFFSHVNKQNRDPANRATAAGYRWRVIGENIAAGPGQDTAADAFAMWKSSQDHNQNMLDPAFRDIGIGREQVPGSVYEWYWTTVFGATG